jgi:UDP-glucose 4-epimerase
VTLSWVIGGSGLLGRHLRARSAAQGHALLDVPIRWEDPPAAVEALRRGTQELSRALVEAPSTPTWNVVWVAGAGVVGTSAEDLAREQLSFAALLEALATQGLDPGRGTLFVASSAGGVYAGSSDPPFTEQTPPRALAPYGVNKLEMEELAAQFAVSSQVPTVVGRISNLYGPGQNLAKAQGLISQIARAHLTRRPISLYVSLDTIRDYLYVGDCADMVLRSLARTRRVPGTAVVKIFASERPSTISSLLEEFRRIIKRRPPVVLADSPNRRFQVRDLRVRSTTWTDLRACAATTLPTGIAATVNDLGARLRSAQL